MLIFHEENEKILALNCADNVKKINLQANGLANHITKAIIPSDNTEINPKLLFQLMADVLSKVPYLLAQYKIGVYLFSRFNFHTF
jgi:hypothetical protein